MRYGIQTRILDMIPMFNGMKIISGGLEMRSRICSILLLTGLAALAANDGNLSAQGWGIDGPSDRRGSSYGQGQGGYGGGYQPGSSQPGGGFQSNGGSGYRPSVAQNANPRCTELENALFGGGGNAQDQVARVDNELRQADAAARRAKSEADRADCYEDMFIFGAAVKRTARCLDLDRQVQSTRSQLAQIRAQRDALVRGNSPRARRDDLVAELARNRCGENYTREYEQRRDRNRSIFSFFTEEEPEEASRPMPSFTSASTFQTKCVRLCDGFYFPVSNSTSENRFSDDQNKCQSQCAAPSELYHHRGDQDVDQMVSLEGRPYTSLPNAFRNRKVFIRGCSCNQSEFSREEIAKSEDALRQPSKRADAGSKTLNDASPTVAPKTNDAASSNRGAPFNPNLTNPQALQPTPVPQIQR